MAAEEQLVVLREQGNALEQALAAQTQQTEREEIRKPPQTVPLHIAIGVVRVARHLAHPVKRAQPTGMMKQCDLQAGSRRRRRRWNVSSSSRTCSRWSPHSCSSTGLVAVCHPQGRLW